MATKTVITGYQEVTHILPADVLDLDKLAAAGGRVVEEFTLQVQRTKLETDSLVRIAVPADKIEQFGGISVDYSDGKWLFSAVKKEDHAITEEVEEVETFGLDEADPLFETKRQILQVERAEQLAKEAEQKAAQEAAALADEVALTAKALEVQKLTAKGKSVAVALAELAAKLGL